MFLYLPLPLLPPYPLLNSCTKRERIKAGMEKSGTSPREDVTATVQPLLITSPHTPPPSGSLPFELEAPIEVHTKPHNALFLFHHWKLEVLALLLSLISFLAMTVLLFKSDEQPLSKWTDFPITLNAFVSILAGIAKASLAFVISMCLSQSKWNWLSQSPQPLIDFDRFDASSRGASGSLRLLKSCIRRP